MGAAALRVYSADDPSPNGESVSLTDRALTVLGCLRTIAAGRIDTPMSAALASLAAVCGKSHTKTRGALSELVRAGMISWDRTAGVFVLLPPSHTSERITRHARGGHAPRATSAAPVACAMPATPGASIERATPVACVPSSSSNQEKSLSFQERGRIREPAREEVQAGLPFPKPALDDPDLAGVADMAMNLAGDVSWGMFVDQMATVGYPAGWIRAAVEIAVAKNRLRRDYVHGILRGYQRDGGPPQAATTSNASPIFTRIFSSRGVWSMESSPTNCLAPL